MPTFGRKAIAFGTLAGLNLIMFTLSFVYASILLLLVALAFAFLSAMFLHRLVRL